MTRAEADDILTELATAWAERVERERRHAEAFRAYAQSAASSAQRSQCMAFADECDRTAVRTMRNLTALNLTRSLAKEEPHHG